MLKSWTGPIPNKSIRHDFILDYFIHPIKRHLARIYLRFLKLRGCTVIGVTGSFGKTSTKEVLYSILSFVAPTKRTTANIDPVYNIPATILSTPPLTKYLILEMGIEYPGEMNFYMWLAPVDIAVITGIGLTHAEFLTNTENIYAEKSQITRFANHIIDYSKKSPSLTSHLEIATEVAKILRISQVDIDRGLASFTPPPHRMHRLNPPSGAIIIDDSYNANPTAVKLTLKILVNIAKKEKKIPVFVFGQMNELGQYEASSHQEIGNLIKKYRICYLLCLGPATKYTIETAGIGKLYSSQENLLRDLKEFLSSKYIILIKGSRSWHLENLIDRISA